MPAGVTPIEMAPERGRATARDGAEHRSLLHVQPRMLLDEGVTLRAEDVGRLHGRFKFLPGGYFLLHGRRWQLGIRPARFFVHRDRNGNIRRLV